MWLTIATTAGRHIILSKRIIFAQGLTVFALNPECFVLSGEATNTVFDVCGLAWSGIERLNFRSDGKEANHNTTEAIRDLFLHFFYQTFDGDRKTSGVMTLIFP